jgi:PAS domain S-box-containing protein
VGERTQLRVFLYPSQIFHRNIFFRFSVGDALLLSVLLFLFAAPSFCAPSQKPVKVLTLYYGDKDAPGVEQLQEGLRTTIERELEVPVWMYFESFDEGWTVNDPSFANSMQRFLSDKYSKRGIDVILAVGDYPLTFMQARRKRLLPAAKLLYVSLGRSPRKHLAETTGMVLHVDLVPTLEIALSQNPGTRHVLLIAGATAVDQAMTRMVLPGVVQYVQDRHKSVDLKVLPPQTLAETRAALAELPRDTVAIFLCYYGDSTGEGFVPARMLTGFSAVASRPIYSWGDVALGRGIVGGSLLNFQANGALLGSLVVQVIRGEKPDQVSEIQGDRSQNMFDWRQMKRWNIAMDQVPAGSLVINQEHTFWQLYKWRIIGLLAIIVIESLLMIQFIRLFLRNKGHVRQLSYEREVEALIAQCAATFINLPPQLIYAGIESSFQQVLEFFELDRISMFEVSEPTSELRLLCTRSVPGVGQPAPIIDLHRAPCLTAQILRGDPIFVERLDDLPAEANTVTENLRAMGIRSFATLPVRHNEKTFATLTFSTIRSERWWPPDLVQALQTIADIFGSALVRKNAESAMSESRDRLQSIIESAIDAILVVDNEHCILLLNPAAEKMFECTTEQVLGQSIERFVPHHLRDQHALHVSRFAGDGGSDRAMDKQRVLCGLRANGESFPIEASVSRSEANGKTIFTAVIRDITERLRSQEELRKSHDLNSLILDSMTNQMVVLDPKGEVISATDRKPDFPGIPGTNLPDFHRGADYFEICRRASAESEFNASAVLAGLQAIYQGTQDHFELELEHGVEPDRRWSLLLITRLRTVAGGVVLTEQDITERKRHEADVRELSGRLINAQENERSRIARELHDDINQQLAILAIELQQLQSSLPADFTESRQKARGLWEKTHRISTDIQHLSHELHSTKLEHLGIIAALRGLCNDFSEQHKVEVDFQFRNVPAKLDSDIGLSLFRVVQESLHNVAKHSGAKRVRVELLGGDDQVVLRVSDDGVGFDPKAPEHRNGLGMVSMSERIRLVGGNLSVTSRCSLGTQVEAVVPLLRKTTAENSGQPVLAKVG